MSRKRKRPRMQLQNRLPDDIFFEILERLPVDSLVRFTTVSKSWKASIKNPSFISSNHHHHHDDSHLVFMPMPSRHPVQTSLLIPETSSTPIPNYKPAIKISRRATLVGFSEGLICFKSTSVLFVWNPFIRTSLKKICGGEIPLNTRPESGPKPSSTILGFGFAPKSRDHRVVKLVCNDDHLSEVEIYSLASDSWRRFKPSPMRFKNMDDREKVERVTFGSSVYLDGSIYWLASVWGNRRWGNRISSLILRFDLEEERFEEIAAPSSITKMAHKLAVINGFLVLRRTECMSWTGINRTIKVQAYINKKSGSSSWEEAKSVDLSEVKEIMLNYQTTTDGHIIVGAGRKRVLVYYGYCDGKNLSFKL